MINLHAVVAVVCIVGLLTMYLFLCFCPTQPIQAINSPFNSRYGSISVSGVESVILSLFFLYHFLACGEMMMLVIFSWITFILIYIYCIIVDKYSPETDNANTEEMLPLMLGEKRRRKENHDDDDDYDQYVFLDNEYDKVV